MSAPPVRVRENGGKDRGTRTFSLFTLARSLAAGSPSVGWLGGWGTYKRAVQRRGGNDLGYKEEERERAAPKRSQFKAGHSVSLNSTFRLGPSQSGITSTLSVHSTFGREAERGREGRWDDATRGGLTG